VIGGGRPSLSYEAGALRARLHQHDPGCLGRAADALATLGGVIEIADVDGVTATESTLAPALLAAGFERDGERLRRSPLRARPLGG